jgi:hypothetical protein
MPEANHDVGSWKGAFTGEYKCQLLYLLGLYVEAKAGAADRRLRGF